MNATEKTRQQHLESIRDKCIEKLESEVEALRTMPEGTPFGDGFEMLEKRRARYIRQGETCLKQARSLPLNCWGQYNPSDDLLFADDFMGDD